MLVSCGLIVVSCAIYSSRIDKNRIAIDYCSMVEMSRCSDATMGRTHGHERFDDLAFQRVGNADRRGFGHRRIHGPSPPHRQ